MKNFIISMVIFMFLISGCAAGNIEESNDHIKIRTETSGQIFLTPPRKGKKHVLIKIVDTESHDLNLNETIKNRLIKRGYQIVDYPDRADYMLQGKVVQSGEVEPEVLKAAYKSRVGTKLYSREVQSQNDLIGRAVGVFLNGTQNFLNGTQKKSYVIIVDLKITEIQEDRYSRKVTKSNKARIVSGANGCQLSLEETVSKLRDNIVNHAVSVF